MKENKKLLLAILLLLFAINASAKRDVALWTAIRDMGIEYQQGQRDSAFIHAQRLLITANDNDDGLAQCVLHNFIGICLDDRGDKHGARNEYLACVDISEKRGYLQRAAKSQLPIYYQTMLNAYAQLVLMYNENGRSQQSLHYARTGMEWERDCKDARIRTTALSVFADELMEHKEYSLIYEPMKRGVQDALRLGKTDIALNMTAHIIYIERNVMGRNLKDIPWVRIGRELMPEAKTEGAKTAYLAAVDLEASPRRSKEDKEIGPARADTAGKMIAETPHPAENTHHSAKEEKPSKIQYVFLHNEWIGIISIVLAAVLLTFVAYIIWQRRRRKREAIASERQKEESFHEGEEDARGRLARELHDGVSNQLLAVEMKLNEDGLTPQTLRLLAESREQVRRVSHELVPPEFEHASLDTVLCNYCNELDEVNNRNVSYSSSPANADWASVEKGTALQLYRITQEVVGNILKHSEATEIAVGLHLNDQTLTIIISDNATAPEKNRKATGIGKQNIRQRTAAIAGKIETFHHPFGNTFRLTIPINTGL